MKAHKGILPQRVLFASSGESPLSVDALHSLNSQIMNDQNVLRTPVICFQCVGNLDPIHPLALFILALTYAYTGPIMGISKSTDSMSTYKQIQIPTDPHRRDCDLLSVIDFNAHHTD